MTKKFIAILISAVMMICPLYSMAADISLVARYDAGVKVNLSGAAEGDAVVTVFSAQDSSIPVFIRQFSAEGTYNFDIQLSSDTPSGKYNVYVTTAQGRVEDSFSFINAERSAAALALLATAKNASEAMSIAESYATDLGIDITDPNYTPNRNEIFALLYKHGVEFDDAQHFSSVYYKMFALSAICGGSSDVAKNMLMKYQSQLGIDYDADVTNDEKLTDDAVSRLYSVLSNTDFLAEFEKRGDMEFLPIFDESKITAAVDAASDWQGIKKAFGDFSYLSSLLSGDAWTAIRDKDVVYSKMMSYTYNNINDVSEGFEKAVAFVKDSETQPGSVSVGGGGGGGGKAEKPKEVVTPGKVEETFEKPIELGFSDYDDTHWSYDAVEGLVELGVISGYEDKTFRPDKTITRAEFTKLIIELSDILYDTSSEKNENVSGFDDVTSELWFSNYVSSALKAGLLNGDGNLFRPYDEITRQDAALIIFRFVSQHKVIGGNKVFADRSEISDYAREAVAALADSGLVSGVGENRFEPLLSLTRAQSAQLLWNTLEFLK